MSKVKTANIIINIGQPSWREYQEFVFSLCEGEILHLLEVQICMNQQYPDWLPEFTTSKWKYLTHCDPYSNKKSTHERGFQNENFNSDKRAFQGN